MLDWRVEGAARAIGGPEASGRRTAPLLLVATVLLLIGALVTNMVRANEARRLEEVRLFVLDEERARAFDLDDELSRLVDPTAPRGWRIGYQHWFERGRVDRGIVVEVTPLLINDGGALVHVERGELGAARYYRRVSERWRRAPLPSTLWGPWASTRSATVPAVTIRYRERDRAFADAIARDLPELLNTIRALGGDPALTSVTIEPVEFATLPATRERERIRVVSPALFESGAPWRPHERARLEIARLLLRDSGPPPAALRPLRNARRLLIAGREIVAQRWALSAETRAAHRSAWAATLGQGWAPPLHSDRDHLPGSDGSFLALDPSQAATMVLVEHLVERGGEVALFEMLAGADQARSWDALIVEHYGSTLLELERRVSRDALGAGSIRAGALPSLPATGRVVATHDPVARHLVTPGSDSPILLSTGAQPLVLPDGSALPIACATLFEEVVVGGRWRVIGRDLHVESMRVSRLEPVPLPAGAARDDAVSIAVLSRGHLPSVPVERSLVMIDSEGKLRSLLPLDGVDLVPDRSARPSTFLLLSQASDACPVAWYFRFEPGRGIVDRWLVDRPAGANSGGFVALDDALIVLQSRITSQGARSVLLHLRPGGSSVRLSPRPLDGGNLLGWSAPDAAFVLNGTREGALTLFEPRSGAVTEVVLEHAVGRFDAALDPEGRALLFIAPGAAPVGGGASLLQYDFASGALAERWHASGALIARGLAVGGGGAPVVLIAGPDRHAEPTRLLQLDPARSGRALEIAATGEGRYIGSFRLCPDGAVLYTDHPTSPVAGRTTTRIFRSGGENARLHLSEIAGTLLLVRCEQ